ncbi:MAG: DNA polymerase III subunit gamma/tau [Bacteroidales bacterium]|nr:DNA polymerase III subunit gamma/tau [Bacteroidales bacterium]
MSDNHYIVSARKYRPSTFASVIGQKPLTAALKHAIATDRLAHAYLFCGSRGIGKTSCARIFAKTINCTHRSPDGEACNECESCQAFNNGTSLNIIELDAASHNGVDDMRALCEQVRVPPTEGRYRVFIIDEVHMLTSGAFNAFLKTLEEPPEYVVFILATTEKQKIIPTILSRCQIYDFSRITIQDMVDHLSYVATQEGVQADPAALGVIAHKADGAMRDALSIFDQMAAASMGNITYQQTIDNLNILDNSYYQRLVEAFLATDVPAALLIYKEIRDKGFDSQFFINGLGQYMRDLMLGMNKSTLPLIEAAEDEKAALAQMASKCHPKFLYQAMDICNDADLNYRAATNKQFLIELSLVKLCQLCSPSPKADGAGEGQLRPITVAAEPAEPYQAVPLTKNAQAAPKPAPAPASYPTPQPQAQPYTAPAPKPNVAYNQPRTAPTGAKRPSISLSIKGAKKDEQPGPAQRLEDLNRCQPYTPEALVKAWEQYAKDHPTERILVNTMAASKPERLEGDLYFVAVYDAIQVDAINDARISILNYLRSALQNDRIDLEARLSEGESSPVTWTERQVLDHMVQEHPTLRSAIQSLGLTLA